VILFGEGSLHKGIHEFVLHYHGERNHQRLGNRLIVLGGLQAGACGWVPYRKRLGGSRTTTNPPPRERSDFASTHPRPLQASAHLELDEQTFARAGDWCNPAWPFLPIAAIGCVRPKSRFQTIPV